MESQQLPTFKLIIVGDSGVGKTTFVQRHLVGESQKKHIAGLDVVVRPMTFSTNFGDLCFNAWDQQHNKPRDGFYIQGQCAIIMFDLSSRDSYKKVPMWYDSITQVCENIPIVLCGNKADIQERKVQQNEIDFHRQKGIPYYEVSAKANYNFERPFLYLGRKLLGNQQLEIVVAPALPPPEAMVDQAHTVQHEY